VAQLPIFSPTDLKEIVDCTLKFYFFQQSKREPLELSPLEAVVLQTIHALHAGGGPYRLNLPTILRRVPQFVPESEADNLALQTAARRMVATYHRRLKNEWANVIASNELMQLNIRLRRQVIQAEADIDRVDKVDDGGVAGLKFIASPDPIPERDLETDIETTLLHALVAATYPNKRPVRIKYLWLYHDRAMTIELTEKQYRSNLEKMKDRLQAWQDGEILARPGPYCERCPFQYQGCPIYDHNPLQSSSQDSETDLPRRFPPANLS